MTFATLIALGAVVGGPGIATIAVDGSPWLTRTARVTDEPPIRLWSWASANELLVSSWAGHHGA